MFRVRQSPMGEAKEERMRAVLGKLFTALLRDRWGAS